MLAGMLKFTIEKLKEDNVDILHVEVTKKSMAQKDVCKGVRVLLLFVVDVCWLSPGETVMLACWCSVWLGVDPNLIEMPQERLCRDVLGEDVGRICHHVDLDDSHDVVEHQLLDEEVLQLDMLCLL